MKNSENDERDKEIALRKYAQDLGVSLKGLSNSNGKFLETELVDRIRETERSRRDRSLWIIKLITCIGVVLSALAAWFVILKR